MNSIITVENLSKKYSIGHQKQGEYQTFRDSLTHGVRSIYQRLCHPFSPNSEEIDTEEFWALKDINFEVKPGDRIGIIGRNGAGKSTLLKILSRITHPTTGKIHIKGRVASLLEVGTGFHPELTGRENIFLNGAILGMTKNDIRKSFDEIVAFSEIEKFLDTPVKRYSSGMYVRLAFAVAAHLEPEILIVDEVLAVGDIEFQKKCLGKMEDIGKEGRTVIFVSHNLLAVKKLCKKAILIDNGRLLQFGDVHPVVTGYSFQSDSLKIRNKRTLSALDQREGLHDVYFTKIELFNPQNNMEIFKAITGEGLGFRFYFQTSKNFKVSVKDLNIGVQVLSGYGHILTIFNSKQASGCFHDIDNCRVVECVIPKLALMPGRYNMKINMNINNDLMDRIENEILLEVGKGDYFKYGVLYEHQKDGVFMEHKWRKFEPNKE